MKVGDVVIDKWDEVSYIVEIHKNSQTVVTFSTKPGRHQPTIYSFEEVKVIPQDDYKPIGIGFSELL